MICLILRYFLDQSYYNGLEVFHCAQNQRERGPSCQHIDEESEKRCMACAMSQGEAETRSELVSLSILHGAPSSSLPPTQWGYSLAVPISNN